MILRVQPLRFEFRALDPISFPPGSAGNIFRGAFGDILRRSGDEPGCRRIFSPKAGKQSPSGFQDPPRPFVLRPGELDGKKFEPGEKFFLGVNVFDLELNALDHFRSAFLKLEEEGLGPGRPQVELIGSEESATVALNLSSSESAARIRVTFLTPTELKSEGEVLREPRFDALLRRSRDRISSLIHLYQGPADPNAAALPDFRGMGERAATVRMVRQDIRQVEHERRSARTGQRHQLGGFIGEAEYEGDLTEFVPWLEAVFWTGVGRFTVWGNGVARVEVLRERGIQ